MNPLKSIVYAISTDGLWCYDPFRRLWSRPKGSDGKLLEESTDGKVPRGVGLVNVSGSSVILAVVENSGIWRLQEGGNWGKTFSGNNLR